MATGEYNGHKNWTHWNVSLWIGNDESLYRLALECKRECKSAQRAAVRFLDRSGLTRTPDGARYSITAVRAAIAGLE